MINEESLKTWEQEHIELLTSREMGEWLHRRDMNARPQGDWIKITKNGTIPVEYICSVCGRKIFDNYELSVPQSVYYPFCHCGADMRGGAE